MRRIQKTIDHFIADEPLPSIAAEASVGEAAAAMQKHKSDCVLIVEDGGSSLVGIFTERDFLNRVAAERRDPGTTKVSEVMTTAPETLHAKDSIAYAINLMVTRGFRNVPILDSDDKPICVLDVRHVMSHINEVFDEVQETGVTDESDWREWTDLGGG